MQATRPRIEMKIFFYRKCFFFFFFNPDTRDAEFSDHAGIIRVLAPFAPFVGVIRIGYRWKFMDSVLKCDVLSTGIIVMEAVMWLQASSPLFKNNHFICSMIENRKSKSPVLYSDKNVDYFLRENKGYSYVSQLSEGASNMNSIRLINVSVIDNNKQYRTQIKTVLSRITQIHAGYFRRFPVPANDKICIRRRFLP